MKKLMIAAAIVCVAAVSQAAMYAWSTGPIIAYGTTYSETEDNTWVGGTYYLIQGDATAAKTAVDAILAAGLSGYASEFSSQVAGAENYGTYSTETWEMSGLKQGTWNADDGMANWEATITKSLPFYQLILDTANDAFYVSEITDSVYTGGVGNTEIGLYNAGYDTYGTDVTAYKGSGWYTVAGAEPPEDVPEPTSGLLLLVGLAGMALKRKVA